VIACTCEVCKSLDQKDKRLRCSALLDNTETRVLIDCGPDVRQQLLKSEVDSLDAVSPFPIYAEPRVQEEIRERFAYAFAKTPYPGAPRFELIDLEVGTPLQIGTLPPILPLRVMHGKLPIIAFRIGQTAYLTDVKAVPAITRSALTNLDTLVTSLLHQREHHSHMNEDEAIKFATEIAAKQTRFIHMSHLAGFHESVEQRLPVDQKLGFDGLVIEIG